MNSINYEETYFPLKQKSYCMSQSYICTILFCSEQFSFIGFVGGITMKDYN